MKKFLLSLILSFFGISVFGQVPPGGYGPGGGSGSGSTTPTFLASTFDATVYGVQANTGQMFFDGGTTNGSPTITTAGSGYFHCPGNVYPCSTAFTTANATTNDVNKPIAVTTPCNGPSCGPYQYMFSKNILGTTQASACTILSIQSATSATSSCNATATCTVASGIGCAVTIAVDWTTQLQAMFTAGFANTTMGCPTFLIPGPVVGFAAQLITTVGALNQCAKNGGTGGHINQLGVIGPTIRGLGQASVILWPLPSYNYAGCTTGDFIANTPVAGLSWKDITISAVGQSFIAAGMTSGGCQGIVTATNAGDYDHFQLTGWGTRFNNLFGIKVSAYSTIENSYISGAGSTGCTVSTNGLAIGIVNSNIGGYQALCVTGGQTSSTGNTYYGPSLANLPMIEVTGGIFQSVNDTQQNLGASGETGAASIIQVDSGATAYITNFIINGGALSTTIPFKVLAGGTLVLTGSKSLGAPTTAISNAGTICDNGGNTWVGAVTNTGVTQCEFSLPLVMTNAVIASRNTLIATTTLIPATANLGLIPLLVRLNAYDSALGSGCGGNSTVTWTLNYTDATGTAQTKTATQTITTNGGTTGGDRLDTTFSILTNPNTAITYSATAPTGGACTTVPSYSAQLQVQ